MSVRGRALVSALPALLVALLTIIGLSGVAVAAGLARAADPPRRGAVVLIGTRGIAWSDISEHVTPNVWALLRDGSSAALSVRSLRTPTCPVDGWLALSAGSSALAPRPAPATAPQSTCPPLPSPVEGRIPGWTAYLDAARSSRSDATLGLLADSAATTDVCVQAVGPGAALAAARGNGTVTDHVELGSGQALLEALNSCPITIVDIGAVQGDSHGGAGVNPGAKEQQLRALDARVGSVLEAAPDGADVILAELSDATSSERFSLAVARGPSFGPGLLASSSTRRAGLVAAADLTTTVLSLGGAQVPDTLTGAILTSDPAASPSEREAWDRFTTLTDLDGSTQAVRAVTEPFYLALGGFLLAVCLAALLLSLPRLPVPGDRLGWQRRVRMAAVAAAAVPVSTFLAGLVPWWRFPVPPVAFTATVLAGAALLAVLALKAPWGRTVLGPLVVVTTVTLAVLAVDVVTGGRLQLSSVMGLQPVGGGRFYGMGNVPFGLFATAALLLTTALSSVLVRLGRRRLAALAVVAVGGAAIVVDGAPFWGADGGGPPALVPALAYLTLAVLGVSMTWKRALVVAVGVVVLVAGVAYADWLRGEERRSHLGGFVQSLLEGNAENVVVRKGQQNLEMLTGTSPLAMLVPVALLVFAIAVAKPSSPLGAPLRRSIARLPTLRAGLIALALALTIGLLLNDSGVGIPPVAASLAVPLLLACGLRIREEQDRSVATTRRARRA